MIQAKTPSECISIAKNAVYDGADAFGLQLEKLLPEYANQDTYRSIYAAMGTRPIYITSYRNYSNENKSDEECMDKLLEGLEAGATLGDIMGDIYCRTEGELTYDREAVARQKDLIDKIHSMGKEVLMSTHVHKFRTADQVLEIALAHQERGADISKIVTGALSEEEEMENLRITQMLKKELSVPFIFLAAMLIFQIIPFISIHIKNDCILFSTCVLFI